MKILKVNGMRCGHCKAAVEEAAAKIPGVSNPVVDLDAKELRYEESAPVDEAALRQAIFDRLRSPITPTTATSFSGRACGLFLSPSAGAFSLENIL